VDIAAIIVLVGVYLLLAGAVSLTECIAAAITVPATVAFVAAQRRSCGGRLQVAGPSSTLLRPLMNLLPDTAEVAGALALAILFGRTADRGAIVRPSETPSDRRIGIRILSESFTPKCFVLEDREGSRVLHCLAWGPTKGDRA
jgi:hypothetical protein